MRIGILGGTGPAGRGVALRAAAADNQVVIGSRDESRAKSIASDLVGSWPLHHLDITGTANEDAAICDVVVVATPWDSALSTVKPLAGALEGKVVISMANALRKEGREFHALFPPRGSMAAAIQAALPASLVSATFHHLPASEMEELSSLVVADVLVCSDHAEATATTAALIDSIKGLTVVDAGSLAQAAPIEAFTATLVTVNIRYKVHAALRLSGYPHGDEAEA